MTETKSEWAEITRVELAKLASKGQTTTYGALYDRLRTIYFNSWPPRARGYHWMSAYIAPILSAVATLNRTFEEPILTALVRNVDSNYVGDGYATAVMNRYGVSVERYIQHAEIETLKCYAVFGAVS